MNEALLLAVGIIVGMFGTIIGVGGGFIVVPLLTFVYGFSPQHAVGTSMAVVALNALSGTAAYVKQRRIEYRTGLLFAAATLPGSYFGAYLLQGVSVRAFDIGFGTLMAGIALYLAMRKRHDFEPVDVETFVPPAYNRWGGMAISFLVGFIASMAGIGGGVVHVPAMIYLFRFPPFIAVPTSHFILAISATFAAASHGAIGEVAWDFLPFLGTGAVIGAQIGGRLSHRVKSRWIVRTLLAVMVVVALRLIGRNIG
ncbi:MAG: sulfite exporter TauE/SafE family protein [Bacteroidetes bacterium]|nr:MAG: sulfite exporter TauE/SafE family protein [Bacteroidota bacterium]